MSTLWVRHAPSSASVVRKSVQATCVRAGLTDDEAFDAALIASELVANAVRHAKPLPSGHLAVEWQVDGNGYRIAVTDGGSSQPITRRQIEDSDVSGRGLMIVAALAQDWGVCTADSNSTTVWARGVLHEHPSPDRVNLQTTG